ncbi:CD1871A family CXXC motif-containing protein [Geosporobacter ferrireducens]|nr:CD1871A family CXXC motif-containing protein [Geosporobacter ferrireducens]
MRERINLYSKYGLFITSILFITFGVLRQEHWVVLKKAINICLECIGLG